MPEWILELLPNNTQNMKTRYGITPQRYIQLLMKQEGNCAICFCRFTKRQFPCIDHCHNDKNVRGLLCHSCNLGLGKFGDNPQIIQQALNYLTKDSTMKNRIPSQPEQVLTYLAKRNHITQATASSVLGISRLAAVVHTLKKRGYNIQTNMVEGVKGMFAEYTLVK